LVLYAYLCVFAHSRFVENPPIWSWETKPLIFEVVLSQLPRVVTLARLASTWSKSLDIDACRILPSVLWRNRKTEVYLVLSHKSKNHSQWFWGPNHQNVATGFESQTGEPSTILVLRLNQETVATSFDVKLDKTVPVVEVKPLTNRRPWFWGSIKKPALLICMHTVQTAHDTTWSLNHQTTEYLICMTIPGPL
jgi:hypothetical protein